MENFVGYNKSILVKWKLMDSDGKPFPVDGFFCKVYVSTGVGREEIKHFDITGADKNVVSWKMSGGVMHFVGSGSLWVDIYRCGLKIAFAERRNAFRVVKEGDCARVLLLESVVTVLHPEEIPGAINVLFPKMEIHPDDMHLYLVAETEAYNSNFKLNADGHLTFKND